MEKTTLCLMLTLVCAAGLPSFAHEKMSLAQKLLKPHVQNRVLVKKKPVFNNFMAGINRYLNAKKVSESRLAKLEVIDFDPKHSMAEALFLYSLDPSVAFVEPDYFISVCDAVPNDTHFGQQWGLSNDACGVVASDVDINAPLLWEHTTGDPSIIVAVLDTGVDFLHSDLAANMWRNPGEIDGNGVDDDLNGHIDDVYGINAVANNSNPMDDNGHGTSVAGIIGAVGNNDLGISGVMQNAKIITCKFMGEDGIGAASDAIKCLDYIFDLKTRANFPVNIVASNNSWATSIYSESLYDAIKRQEDAQIAFVAAADNFGLNNDFSAVYPANYALSNVISVAAIDQHGLLANFSNFGRHSVHVAAPGVAIRSTALRNLYTSTDGTSMAAPFVTGMLGILSHHFANNTMVQNRNLLISSQKPLPRLSERTIAGGMLRGADVQGIGAISCQDRHVFQTTLPKQDLVSYELNHPVDVRVLNINCENPSGDFSATLSPSLQNIDFHDDGDAGDLTAEDGVYSASFTPADPGAYELDLAGILALNVEVYDSTLWQSYLMTKNENFSYTQFLGTKIELGDDDVYGLILPFKVPFANDATGLSHIYIGSNGTLSLSDHEILDFANTKLPSPGFSSILAPLWLDLDPSRTNSGEGVFYQISGDEPHRQLVVEWRNVKHRGDKGKVSFEVTLNEDSAEIIYSYRDLDLNAAHLDGAISATIGIQVRDLGTNMPSQFFPIADGSTFTLSIAVPDEPSEKKSAASGQNRKKSRKKARSVYSGLDARSISLPLNTAPAPPAISAPKSEFFLGQDPLNLVIKNAFDHENDLLTYEFEIHDKADFSNLIYAKRAQSAGNQAFAVMTFPKLPTDKVYFWRARAFDGNLFSDWSTGEFRLVAEKTAPAPDTKSMALPAGCSTTDASADWWALVGVLGAFTARLRHKKAMLARF